SADAGDHRFLGDGPVPVSLRAAVVSSAVRTGCPALSPGDWGVPYLCSGGKTLWTAAGSDRPGAGLLASGGVGPRPALDAARADPGPCRGPVVPLLCRRPV